MQGINPETEIYHKKGDEYETFRPVYPPEFTEKIRKAPKTFDNYLDLAIGTGQVFFQIQDCFIGLVAGADISDSMLDVAKRKAETLKSDSQAKEFAFISGNCQKIDELLKQQNIVKQFDLVTIGEAFHWFEMENLLKTLTNSVLKKNGTLAILSYPTPTVELNSENKELQDKVVQAYKDFFNAVSVYQKFNSSSLDIGYADIPFEKYFTTIEKDTKLEKVPSSLKGITGHLGTWSMYNTYVEKHSKDEGYKDPLQVFEGVLESVRAEAEKNGDLIDTSKSFLTVLSYQLIVAYNSI